MRIALRASTALGDRVGRILQAEADLRALGLWESEGSLRAGRRTMRTPSLAGYDVVILESVDDIGLQTALDHGVSIVTPDSIEDTSWAAQASSARVTLVHRADLAGGIAEVLAAHESARSSDQLATTVAWTTPGKPLTGGAALPFPGPVGAKWAEPVPGRPDAFVAPVAGKWGAAMARVTSAVDDGVVQRILGAADLDVHLASIAMAAAAVTVARGTGLVGLVEPAAFAEAHLSAALEMGLEVAAYTADA